MSLLEIVELERAVKDSSVPLEEVRAKAIEVAKAPPFQETFYALTLEFLERRDSIAETLADMRGFYKFRCNRRRRSVSNVPGS
jgi:hypothetical protein